MGIAVEHAATVMAGTPVAPARPRRRWVPFRAGVTWQQLVWAVVVWACVVLLFGAGISVRRWAWVETQSIRFQGDLRNAHGWGLRVCVAGRADPSGSGPPTWGEFFKGYRAVYDQEVETPGMWGGGPFPLDYAPLRLLVMSLWTRWTIVQHPADVDNWYPRDVEPLLWFNAIMTAIGAAGAFFLVRHWVARQQLVETGRAGAWRPWVLAGAAAMLLWLDPAVIVNAHVWPQWDVWCVPFFLWAAYAASRGSWLAAGALVMTGAMLKGQVLIAAPVLLIWAIGAGGWRAAVGFVVGFAAAAAAIASPWLVPTAAAWGWIGACLLALIVAWVARRSTPDWRVRMTVAVAALGVGWPLLSGATWDRVAIAVAAWAIACVPLVLSRQGARRSIALCATAAIAVSVWGAYWLYGGSLGWVRIGFLMPTDARMVMSMGATNFPNLLAERWAWSVDDLVWTEPVRWLGLTDGVTIRVLLRGVYALALVLCGIAAAVHARRGSARVLIALAAPWVLLYALLPQLHERHFTWAAAITVIGIGASLDMVLLHGIVSFMAAGDILLRLLKRDGNLAPRLKSFLEGISPDAGWVVLLVAGAYLYLALKPERRRQTHPPSRPPLQDPSS